MIRNFAQHIRGRPSGRDQTALFCCYLLHSSEETKPHMKSLSQRRQSTKVPGIFRSNLHAVHEVRPLSTNARAPPNSTACPEPPPSRHRVERHRSKEAFIRCTTACNCPGKPTHKWNQEGRKEQVSDRQASKPEFVSRIHARHLHDYNTRVSFESTQDLSALLERDAPVAAMTELVAFN